MINVHGGCDHLEVIMTMQRLSVLMERFMKAAVLSATRLPGNE